MSQRYENLFKQLKNKQQIAFVPFVVLGDPSFEQSIKIIETLITSGADALELGIPFSDPMADGPTIQNANLRAFSADINVEKAFAIISKIRNKYSEIPIGLLMYANLIYKNGINEFYAKCKNNGVDSVLIADLPMRASDEFTKHAENNSISPIFICPPEPNDDLIKNLAYKGQGYTYLLSRAGVTGANDDITFNHQQLVAKLKNANVPPILQGFGISNAKQVEELVLSGVDGVISGSAVVNIIEKNLHDFDKMLEELTIFTLKMKKATFSAK